MAFLNIDSSLIINSYGDIYTFKLTKSGLELIVLEKSTGQSKEPNIIVEDILEYDVSINEKDEIDIFCKMKDGSLSIYSLIDSEWKESEISNATDQNICGLKIITVNETRHIFYYMELLKNDRSLNIYHHYMEDGKWNTNVVKEIYKSEIIKPIEIIKNGKSLIIGYYDLGKYSEDIFISRFDSRSNKWLKSFNITNDDKFKLYLDILEIDDYLHITYSEYEDENLIIKHKKVKTDVDGTYEHEEVIENVLSNQANCTYPTLVYSKGVLWNVWTEYESVSSSYSKDNGDTWSNPYVWSESKKSDFNRCKFSTTEDELKISYVMNYAFSKVYPELSFLGFGSLDTAIESVKKKEESDDKIVKLQRELDEMTVEHSIKIRQLQREIEDMRIDIRNISSSNKDENFNDLEKRVSNIENHINIRRRNPFAPRG